MSKLSKTTSFNKSRIIIILNLIAYLLMASSISFLLIDSMKNEANLFTIFFIAALCAGIYELITLNKKTFMIFISAAVLLVISFFVEIPGLNDISMSIFTSISDGIEGILYYRYYGFTFISEFLVVFVVSLVLYISVTKLKSVILSFITTIVCAAVMLLLMDCNERSILLVLILCLAGMFILSVNNKFQKSGFGSPTVWYRRALPPVALIVLVTYLLTPFEAETIYNPELNDKIMDLVSGRINNQTLSASFDLNFTGFMNERDGKLGGPVNVIDYNEFKVRMTDGVGIPETLYLRGSVKDYYDGSKWTNNINRSKLMPFTENSDKLFGLDENMLSDSGIKESDFDKYGLFRRRSYFIDSLRLRTATLFNELRTYNIMPLSRTGSKFLDIEINELSETYANDYGNLGSYSVGYYSLYKDFYSSYLYNNISFSDYIKSGYAAHLLSDITDYYLQVPESITDRVRTLTNDITEYCVSDYQKAEVICNYLSSYYNYTLKPKEVPDGVDFVDYFLFEEREGYCVYYATAMVMMCRIAGIPARYVTGYRADNVNLTPVQVKSGNAHAWTEIYMPNIGWVTFDPVAASDFRTELTPPPSQGETNTPEPVRTTPPPVNKPSSSPTPKVSPTPTKGIITDEPVDSATPTIGPSASPTGTFGSGSGPAATDDKEIIRENTKTLYYFVLAMLVLAALIGVFAVIYKRKKKVIIRKEILLLNECLELLKDLDFEKKDSDTLLGFFGMLENEFIKQEEKLLEKVFDSVDINLIMPIPDFMGIAQIFDKCFYYDMEISEDELAKIQVFKERLMRDVEFRFGKLKFRMKYKYKMVKNIKKDK